MATTTMLFGPEWMRPKNPARSQNPPSPPPNTNTATNTPSSYSALVATMQNSAQDNPDQSNPFLYSKEEMLRIYKEGGGRGGLGLEVERWEGVVREVGNEPAALKEWTEAERKLFSGALNSEMRRRQSSDYLSPLTTSSERPKLNGSSVASPMRERFNLIARRRDSSDQATTTAPRKLSLNAGQGPFGPTRDTGMPSPRTRGPLTPGGIDGVLSSGDTWMSRRRASEAGKAAALRGEGDSSDGGGSKIKEEDEEEGSASNNWRAGARDRNGADGDESKKSAGGGGEVAEQAVASGTSNMASLKLQGDGVGDANAGAGQSDARNDTASSAGTVSTPARPPGLPADLAAIEWSYLDPQGQVQGPFRADVMQSWSQQGYFQPDLPVKRTSIDHEFTPLGLLVQRLGTEKVFLTPFDSVTSTPPGLTQNPDMPPDNTGSRDPALAYSVPYQPIPTRTSQISALENYYGSNSPAPHSPASSFGVARFSNGTPDPGPFATRLPGQMVDSTVGQRAGFAQDPYGGRRQALGEQTYSDPQFDPAYGRIPYNTFGPARTSSADSYNFGAQPLGYSSNQMPWGPAMGQNGLTSIRTNTLDPFNPLAQDQSYVASSPLRGPPTSQAQDAFSQRDVSRAIPAPASGPSPSSFDANQQYTPSPSLGYTAAPGTAPPINRVASNSSFIGSSQASWPAATDIQSAPKRTGTLPFEQPAFPTSRNTIPLVDRDTMPPHGWASSTQAQSQTQPKTPSAVEGGSPWYNASVGIVDDGWRQVEGLNSLTVSNLGQHNQQQAQEEALAAATATAVAVAGTQSTHEAMVAPEPAQEEAVEPPAEPASQAPAKPKRKVSVTPTPVATSAPVPAPAEALVAESPPTPAPATTSPPAEPAPSKAVWSTDDDKKRGTSMSLREIQEVEARKAAERKAAERAARPTYTPTEEAAPAPPFTASWGLPTSQAGAGVRVVAAGVPAPAPAPAKEANSTPSTSVPAAPWANGKGSASGVKKTMKEIQEEEERRKAREAKEIASASARRGYADTTTKVTPTVASGGAWTTVGSNGKTAAAVAAPASRPATTTTTPTAAATVTTQTARKSAAVSTPSAKPIVKSVPTPVKVDDAPIAPSPDFMKWLSESLRSLDSSVSYDDIVSMLLSFPLEVDASTQELISDLIYANSATLDGRRFAVDFVARRKTDAAGRKGVKGGPSIADVVKAQPKPTPGSEWGAFKVVNKKKKGGKA